MTAVLVAIVAALLGLVTYAVQEGLKRRSELLQRRQLLYESLLRDLFELLVAETGEERSTFITRIEQSWLFASDQVLVACYRFLSLYDDLCRRSDGDVLATVRSNQEIRDDLARSFAEIFVAMRRDIRRSRISQDWAQEVVRIYPWGIITRSQRTPGEQEHEPSRPRD